MRPAKEALVAVLRAMKNLAQLGESVTVHNLIEHALVLLPSGVDTARKTGRLQVQLAYDTLLYQGFLICRGVYVTRGRKTRSSRVGRPWSHTEDKELVANFVARVSVRTIAALLSRTEGSIRSRISRLGLQKLPELQALLAINPPSG